MTNHYEIINIICYLVKTPCHSEQILQRQTREESRIPTAKINNFEKEHS